MNSISSNIGKTIRMIRAKRGLTQGELATRARISVAYLSLIERNARTPNLEVLEELAAGLDVPPNILLLLAGDLSALEQVDRVLAERLSLIALKLIEGDNEQASVSS